MKEINSDNYIIHILREIQGCNEKNNNVEVNQKFIRF